MKKQNKTLRRTRNKGIVFRVHRKQESGQTIVLMALALVGLLVSTGLAVDGAMLMVRKAQLDRAVDAAALAGVVKVGDAPSLTDIALVHAEGQIVMAANGIPVANPVNCAEPRDWNSYDYCGTASLGSFPGAVRYHVEAEWHSDTYFVSLVGITRIPIISEATAEYFTLVDMYASDTTERGLLNLSDQAMFGPGRSSTMGDAYSSTDSDNWKDLTGAYTYRIRVPRKEDYPYSKVRVEIFDPDTYNTKAAVATSSATAKPVYRTNGTYTSKVCPSPTNVPWTACIVTTRANESDPPQPNDNWFFRADEIRWTREGQAGVSSGWNTLYPSHMPTHTMFRLYYMQQSADGTLHEVDLAYYVSGADSHTDLMWVSPGASADERMPAFDGSTARDGAASPITDSTTIQEVFTELGITSQGSLPSPAEPQTFTEDCEAYRKSHYGASTLNTSNVNLTNGAQIGDYKYFTLANECAPNTTNIGGNSDFIVDLENETKGIYVDPSTGIRDIYLQVRTLDGFSENGFGFWAGPPRTAENAQDFEFTVPAEVNARQTYIVAAEAEGYEIHRSKGVTVFGIGHLPMNSMFSSRPDKPSDIPLAYLGPEFAGRKIKISIFDTDAGAKGPITFHFDTIHDKDWSICFKSLGTANPLDWGNCVGQSTELGKTVLPIPNNDRWASAEFIVPSDSAGHPFYGGRLYARYFTYQADTFVWKITTEGRPFLVK